MPRNRGGTSGHNEAAVAASLAEHQAKNRSEADVLSNAHRATPDKIVKFLVWAIGRGHLAEGPHKAQAIQTQLQALDAILTEE